MYQINLSIRQILQKKKIFLFSLLFLVLIA